MLPQQGHPAALAAGTPPVYGQPGFYSPPNQGMNVPVGIPAGLVPMYGSVAQGSNAVPAVTLVHVGNVVPGVAHVHTSDPVMSNAHMGNLPAQSLPANNSFVQAQQSSLIQPSGSNNVYENPLHTNLSGQGQGHPRHPRSPPSSFPPGFEPRHSNNIFMGIPSQPASNNCGTGGMDMHTNQHQHQFQQQQQHQQPSQLQFQHQQHFLSQSSHHQYHQPGQQPPNQRQSQHFQNQSSHSHQHQRQQHSFQQSQHQHHNKYQHVHQFQNQYNSQYQHQHQHQQNHPVQQQLQHEHQQYQHSHSQPQNFLQTQPQNFHQSNPHPQLQLETQPHPASQQVQPLMQLHQPNFQTCSANGVAIGLPVMPTPCNLDATSAQSIVHSQHPTPAWQQPTNVENSSSTSQLFKTNVLGNCPSVQGELHPNGQHPAKIHRAGEAHAKSPGELAQSMSSSMPKARHGPEGMRSADSPRIDHKQGSGHMALCTTRPSSSIESNHRNWLSPPRVQLRGAGNPSRASRDYQPRSNWRLKSQSNRPFPAYREKFGDGQLALQWQNTDFGGKPFSKGLGKRSDMQSLRCEPCDRTFTTSDILADHLKSHIKCGEEGCLFEAAGKVVKEHKVVEHGKVEFQSTYRGRKALALRSMEDQEEIKRWREERKRSYPSSENILRKAEEKRKREAEGESFDEEAQQRRQRMMEIISKQKQLGYQVPEIPSHYFRPQYNRQSKKSRGDKIAGPPLVQEERPIVDDVNGESGNNKAEDASIDIQEREASSHDKPKEDDKQYHRNGHFKKGYHNKFSSRQDRRKPHQNCHPRVAQWQQPSLLSKLLSKDIKAENSHLLQCCRFIVNNSFLQDSLTSLKHFEWIQAASWADGSDHPVNVKDPKITLNLVVGEEVSTSWDNSSGEEQSYQVSDSKNPINKEVNSKKTNEFITDKHVTCCDVEDARDVSTDSPRKRKGNEDQDLVQSGRSLHQTCLPNDSGEMESNAGRTVQMHTNYLRNDPVELNQAASDKMLGDVQTSWKPRSASSEFLAQDLEAGEVASGNSESVVEDEEDISQYMNLDVSGADSGCCYD